MTNVQSGMIDVISVVVVLGIMIFVHEWGHFIAAKLAGVRVEIFSLGFGTRLFGVKRGDTDYRISALPFGGYVRMAGDNPVEERAGAPDEFLSKPRWVRVLIAIAGPAMNILLAFVIFWGIFWRVGTPTPTYLLRPAVVAAIPESPAGSSGIQPGDQILEVNGGKTPTWEAVFGEVSKAKPGDSISITVLRNGAEATVTAKVDGDHEPYAIVGYPAVPAVVDRIGIGTPAEKSGMKPGDTIVSINGKPVLTWLQVLERVHQSGGQAIQFIVHRDAMDMPLSITPMHGLDADGGSVWQIGVSLRTKEDYQPQGFLASAKFGTGACLLTMREIKNVLAGLFTGKVSIRQLQGVIGIARESGRAAKDGPQQLFELMALISVNLGLLNLLPIPILDGGHVLLLAIEGLLRRDLSIAVKERFVQVGLVFLLGIFAFVMYSDILKLVQSH